MKTQTLETAQRTLLNEKITITGMVDTVGSIQRQLQERAAEVDEHARRMGDFIFSARQVAGEEPAQQERLAQARNDAKGALAPMLARDLWRELAEACESIGGTPTVNERDTYLSIVAWLFERPIEPLDGSEIQLGNCVPHLKTTKLIADLFPIIGEYIGHVIMRPLEPAPVETVTIPDRLGLDDATLNDDERRSTDGESL